MASLQQEPTGTFHIVLRVGGQRFKRSLGTKQETEAVARREEIEETLTLVKRGRIHIPDRASIPGFILAGGNAVAPKRKPRLPRQSRRKPSLSIGALLESFFDSIPPDSLEDSTLKTMRIQERHLRRLLDTNLHLDRVTGQSLQAYVNGRATEFTQFVVDKSKPKEEREFTRVSSATIRKEVKLLGSVWRWGTSAGLITTPFPNAALRWPKTDEKPPFQTFSEIERQIELEELSSAAASKLWHCLYLRSTEISALLAHAKIHAPYPCVYPIFALAAYTGARRSELLRSRLSDFDLDARVITIRERKRVKGKRSSRRVPLSPALTNILREWFETHPGGPWAFAVADPFAKHGVRPISRTQIHNWFRTTLDGSKWEKLRGWHCLRHSFISNLACAGVDQRLIDEFVGHTSEEMRCRYRHLFPDVKHSAITQAFA